MKFYYWDLEIDRSYFRKEFDPKYLPIDEMIEGKVNIEDEIYFL